MYLKSKKLVAINPSLPPENCEWGCDNQAAWSSVL